MPKIVQPMTALALSKLKRTGFHAVGGVAGLGIQIRQSSTSKTVLVKSWIMRVMIGEQRVPLGLGSYPQVSLNKAREIAHQYADDIKNGIDPRAKKKALKSALLQSKDKTKTFKECAKAYMAAHASDYRNEKHRKQWETTLETYAYPYLGKLLVSDITMKDVLKTLNQPFTDPKTRASGTFWTMRTETAKRVQGRIKTVFDYAIVSEYRNSLNPATWTGYLETQLAKPSKIQRVEHHPAVPYQEVGDFVARLRAKKSISAKALDFLILTGVRSGSVRESEWSEIDFDNKVWNIPPEHTKTNQAHRVPLPPQAINLLKSLDIVDENPRIFPSPKGVCLSDSTLSKLMRDMRSNGEFNSVGVPHGFRSTFRDWAAEMTKYPDDIRKVATMHEIGDAVQQAYQRTDLLEKRRRLMIEWANFLDKPSIKLGSNVTQLRKKA